MHKPEGFARVCAPGDVALFLSNWHQMLAVIRAGDAAKETSSSVIGRVLETARVRSAADPMYALEPRSSFNEHDVITCDATLTGRVRLPDLIDSVLQDCIGLRCTGCGEGWLNRVTIELVYGESKPFLEHRHELLPKLLAGPVRIALWTGEPLQMAFLLKLLVREQFGVGPMTNLLHVDQVDGTRGQLILESLETGIQVD